MSHAPASHLTAASPDQPVDRACKPANLRVACPAAPRTTHRVTDDQQWVPQGVVPRAQEALRGRDGPVLAARVLLRHDHRERESREMREDVELLVDDFFRRWCLERLVVVAGDCRAFEVTQVLRVAEAV